MAKKYQRPRVRRGPAALWESSNTPLKEGELGLETDTGLMKGGIRSDGNDPNSRTNWNDLPYTTKFRGDWAEGMRLYPKDAFVYNKAIYQVKAAAPFKAAVGILPDSVDGLATYYEPLSSDPAIAGFTPIAQNEYGTHPAANNLNEALTLLFTAVFNGAYQPPTGPTKIVNATARAVSDTEIELNFNLQ